MTQGVTDSLEEPQDGIELWPTTAVGTTPGATDVALARVCDPLFQLVCRLNRSKRLPSAAASLQTEPVHKEFVELLATIGVKSRAAGCHDQFVEVLEPLKCFVDIVMMRGGFPFSGQWLSLSSAENPDALLCEAAFKMEGAASELPDGRMMVIYASLCLCIDLIVTEPGDYSILELVNRIDGPLRSTDGQLFCPGAYEGVFTRTMLQQLGRRLRVIAAASAAIMLLAIATAIFLNLQYYQAFTKSVDEVQKKLNSPQTIKQNDN